MANYFMTGATGLGRQLVGRLIERGADITLLVRPRSIDRHGESFAQWAFRAERAGGRLTVVAGDVTAEGLGLEDAVDPGIDHFFHVAGYYDIEGDPETMRSVNVDGTRNVLVWLRERDFGGVFHHLSSVAVAGDYAGELREDELDVGQSFSHPYHRSKFDAETLVREAGDLRTRIYRPGAVVGDSRTGEMDRVDGPYFLFQPVRKLGQALPGWFPLIGWTTEPVNMVPVDWVADVVDYIAHLDGHDGETFHLVDPNPLTLPQLFNQLAAIAGAPKISRNFGGGNSLVPGLRDMIASLGATKFVREQLMDDFDIPPEVSAAKNADVRFAVDGLLDALEGADLDCPRPESYLPVLWHYWALHLDPDRDPAIRARRAFEGKTVLVTGSSSGIGEALARHCAELGAHVICVARREELLAEIVSEISQEGGRATYYVADLSEVDEVEELIDTVLAEHGGVDILVNNAAKSIRRSIAESYDRVRDYRRVMELNYLAPVRLCLGFLPAMVERGGGHIVSVLTAGAGMPSPRFSAYTASKAALGQFTDTLSAEYLHQGIRTTSAYLSWVATPMMTATDKYREKAEREEIMTPNRAAEWIVAGVAQKKRKLHAAETARRFVWSVIFPRFMTRALSLVFQIYHDDRDAFAEFDFDRTVLERFFKTDLV